MAKFLLRDGRMLLSTAIGSVGRFVTDLCASVCCGPRSYFGYKPCGLDAPSVVWLHVNTIPTIIPPAVLNLLNADGETVSCYCATGERKRLGELPFDARIIEWLSQPGYANCCKCISDNSTNQTGCSYVPPDAPGQNGQECCCNNVRTGLLNSRYTVNGSATYVLTIYQTFCSSPPHTQTITITTSVVDNILTRVYTDSDSPDPPFVETYEFDFQVQPICGYQAMRQAAEYALLVGIYAGRDSIPIFGSSSSTCDQGTATASQVGRYEDNYNSEECGLLIYREDYVIDVQVTVQLKSSGAVCACNPEYDEPDGMAMVPESLAGDPMGVLPA